MPRRARRGPGSPRRRRCGSATSSGPDPGGGEPFGRQQRRSRARRPPRSSTASISVEDPLERQELGVGDERLAEPAHPVRRRLHREHDPPLEALLRALELARAQVAGGDLGDLLDADVDARGEILLARADVDADEAGVRVLRREASRPSTPCRASRGSPGRAATTRSRRGSSRGATRRSGAGRSARCRARRGRGGTARCPCAGSAARAPAPARAAVARAGARASALRRCARTAAGARRTGRG